MLSVLFEWQKLAGLNLRCAAEMQKPIEMFFRGQEEGGWGEGLSGL